MKSHCRYIQPQGCYGMRPCCDHFGPKNPQSPLTSVRPKQWWPTCGQPFWWPGGRFLVQWPQPSCDHNRRKEVGNYSAATLWPDCDNGRPHCNHLCDHFGNHSSFMVVKWSQAVMWLGYTFRQRLFAELLHIFTKELHCCIYTQNKTCENWQLETQ